jgi:hypothetical protein
MAEFKTHLLLWISTTLEHLGVIGTGGILVLLIQLAEKRWPKYSNWKISWPLFLAFALFAVFQSWESEYLSKTGRERDLVQAHQEFDLARAHADSQRFSLSSVNQSLQHQNRDQQNTINGCLSQAMKLLTPAQLQITVLGLRGVGPKIEGNSEQVLLLTNKAVAPADILVTCDFPIHSLYLSAIGSQQHGGVGIRINDRQWEAWIQMPAWTPSQPILATVGHNDERIGNCKFEVRNPG